MAGSWQKLNAGPGFAASTMLLLTDGTVMCQQSGGVSWAKLSPNGGVALAQSYIQGSWTPLSPMLNTRLYYASAVLRDGRVIVCGGEYSNAGSETNRCEIYDPISDTWSALAPPAGWAEIGDGASCLLPDGRLLLGDHDGTRTAIYDPVAGTWSAGPTKGDSSSEETWTLLPDQTVLTVQCSNRPNAEKYVAAANQWVSAGTLPVDLVEAASIEVGPACLLPDGSVFCIGATRHTALYHPPAIANQPGNWTAGPDFPDVAGKTIGAKDAAACLLPNGKVLLVGGPVDGQRNSYLTPTYFFEYDGSSISRVPDPNNSTGKPYQGRMLLLPTGQVLFAAETNEVWCYTPDGVPDEAWRPSITGAPSFAITSFTYTLHGRQLNGLSQAVSYGDDAAMATNYPIVRLRSHSGRVHYCRTFGHSTMAVATGTAVHSTNFQVPAGVANGPAELTVIANGIAAHPVCIDIAHFRFPRPQDLEAWAWLIGSLADGPLWVWGPHGPVPVDPWGPKIAREAEAARRQMLAGMRALQALGARVTASRIEQSAAVPPAVDLDALEAAATTSAAKPRKRPLATA